MLVPTQMGINTAAGNEQKHLSLSFATKAWIKLSRDSKHQNNTFTSNPDNHYYFIGILWKVRLNPSKSEVLFEKYNSPGKTEWINTDS